MSRTVWMCARWCVLHLGLGSHQSLKTGPRSGGGFVATLSGCWEYFAANFAILPPKRWYRSMGRGSFVMSNLQFRDLRCAHVRKSDFWAGTATLPHTKITYRVLNKNYIESPSSNFWNFTNETYALNTANVSVHTYTYHFSIQSFVLISQ